MPVRELQLVVYASLMAALIAVGSYLFIPIGPIPIVLQNLFVVLAGLLLGKRWALVSVGVFLLVGAIGIPVFAGGKGGIAHFLGPTGGYLIGYLFSAYLTGLISESMRGETTGDVVACLAGFLAVYLFGVPWLVLISGMTWGKAVAVGMLPFLIGDAGKVVAAVFLARAVRPVLNRQLASASA